MVNGAFSLDRELQREILTLASRHYPQALPDRDYQALQEGRNSNQHVLGNIYYLIEHGLMEKTTKAIPGARNLSIHNIQEFKVTHRGLDFIADDGGLSAILGVITVKFHEDTLHILTEKIMASDLPQSEKQSLTDGLRALPAEGIKHLTLKLLDAGAANIPRAIELIRTLIS